MKKFFVGIAATVLAAAMCVSFAACGGNGAEKAKSIKGEQVTAEQWDAAFEALTKEDAEYTFTRTTVYVTTYKGIPDPEANNKKLNGTSTATEELVFTKKGNKESEISKTTGKLSGDARRIAIIMGVDEEEIDANLERSSEEYVEKTNEGYVSYEQKDGKWTKGNGSSMAPSYSQYKGKFESYEYSEEHKGYIPKDYSAEDKDELEVIKFDKDGRLVAIYTEMSEEGDKNEEIIASGKMSVTIEYSAKDITLPTVA